MTKSFSADIKNWNDKARRNMQGIMREATQELVEDAQLPVSRSGNMPVDTGNLRNTLASGLNGTFGRPAEDSYIVTIAGMKPGDVAQFGWTAAYARARHYKPESFGQGGGMFRDKAVQKWQRIVDRVAKRFS
jgi:hypothetical protein